MIGRKTRRYFLAKRDPNAAIFEQLSMMDSDVKEEARGAANQMLRGTLRSIELEARRFSALAMERMDTDRKTLLTTFQKMMRDKIDSLPHLKGDPGKDAYTPKKGVDYFDGKQGDAGYTPQAGRDYPTAKAIEEMVSEYAARYVQSLEEKGFTKKEIGTELKKENLDGNSIARMLEALKGAERLDYESLKNRPGTEVKDISKKRVHRGGGGKETYYYDLSSLCDDVTKVFTVPSNSRIVSAFCTDAPSGILRPITDWTGSGTTTLTLTAQVAAPGSGATLYILYVV